MTRSENMAKVKGRNTGPEVYLRKRLWHAGLRYRCNDKRFPGKPDIYIPRKRLAIFVNGCFWHQHEGCRRSRRPKTNIEFWDTKLDGNVARDERRYAELAAMGIRVAVVWECALQEMQRDEAYEAEVLAELLAFAEASDTSNAADPAKQTEANETLPAGGRRLVIPAEAPHAVDNRGPLS